MIHLAMLSILIGGLLCYNGYQTLYRPLPQHELRYTTLTHRGTAMAVLLAGIFLCCAGLALSIVVGVRQYLEGPDPTSCYT